MTPILKTLDEMDEDRQNIDDPDYVPKQSVNAVTDTPQGFQQYMQDNAERMKGWSSTPYYIKDNLQYVDGALKGSEFKEGLLLTVDQNKTVSDFQAFANNHQENTAFTSTLQDMLKAKAGGDRDEFYIQMKRAAAIFELYPEGSDFKFPAKITAELKHKIYEKPLEEQFIEIQQDGSKHKIMQHILKEFKSEDYHQIIKAATAYSGIDDVWILPEIHKSETEVRKRLGITTDKRIPDLKIGEVFIDVKSPMKFSNIIGKATSATGQGAIACITDDRCEIKNGQHLDNLAQRILDNKDYKKAEVHFLIDGVLYKYNGQGIVPGQGFSASRADFNGYQSLRGAKVSTNSQTTNKQPDNSAQNSNKRRLLIRKRTKSAKERRHERDDRIAEFKTQAAKYPGKKIDITAIEEAYTSLDLKRLDQTIKAKEDVVCRHEKVLAIADKRHAKRTEAQEDHIFAAWHARKPALHVLQMKEPELRRMHALLFGSKPYDYSADQLAAVEIFSEMNKTKEAMQRYADRYKQKNIRELLEAFKKTYNWESQALLAERIRQRCTAQAKADLEKMKAVDGLTFVGTTRNCKIGTSNTYQVKGQTIMVAERYYDLITFKDSLGQTYSYPLGGTKADVKATVDAGKAAVEWAKKPKYIHDNNQGFIFINDDHPMDAYYRVKYNNFTRGAMYSSDPVTVHTHYNPKDFADTACHEVGHHIYYRNKLEAEYEKAKAKDPKGKFPTSYSKEATTEDFAESIQILNEGEERAEWFKQKFPNRYEFIRTHVPGLKTAGPPSAKKGKDATVGNGTPSTAPARKPSTEELERMRIEELFDTDQNRYIITYTKEQKENNAQIEIILGQRQKAYMDHQQADSGSVNPGDLRGNCALCTLTYELRRRGFNVKAKPFDNNPDNRGFQIGADKEEYPDFGYKIAWNGIQTETAKATKKLTLEQSLEIRTSKPGRYHLAWDWDEDEGHMIVAERLNDGTLVLYDPQKNEYKKIDTYFKKVKSIDVYKVDSATINTDAIKEIVERYQFRRRSR